MFVCDKCFEERKPMVYPSWLMPQSYGPCEICGKVATCADYHGYLPPLKKELKETKE
jgi:hypothetical protein